MIRVPDSSSSYNPRNIAIKDIPSMFVTGDKVAMERGDQVYSLRNMMDTVSPNDVDAHLWGLNVGRSEWKLSLLDPPYYSRNSPPWRDRYPFFSELPSNFSTGLVGHQYA